MEPTSRFASLQSSDAIGEHCWDNWWHPTRKSIVRRFEQSNFGDISSVRWSNEIPQQVHSTEVQTEARLSCASSPYLPHSLHETIAFSVYLLLLLRPVLTWMQWLIAAVQTEPTQWNKGSVIIRCSNIARRWHERRSIRLPIDVFRRRKIHSSDSFSNLIDTFFVVILLVVSYKQWEWRDLSFVRSSCPGRYLRAHLSTNSSHSCWSKDMDAGKIEPCPTPFLSLCFV